MDRKIAKKLLEKVKKDYESIAEEFDKTRKNEWQEFEKFLKYVKNNNKIADLGCGNGRLLNFLKKNNKKIRYIGIDNSEQLIQKAKKTYKKDDFIKGDLLKIPIKTNSQDIAISIAILHHIPSKKLREKAINEFSRILKKNGTLILTVWNLFQPKYKKYIWLSRLRHLLSLGRYDSRDTFIPWGKSGIKRYYYAFRGKELEKLLKKKFEITEKYINRNFVYICKKK